MKQVHSCLTDDCRSELAGAVNFKSKYGGNDPDVWDAGKCEACDGSGNATCDARGCDEPATAFNDDGEALCQDCFQEWAVECFEP